MDTNEKRWQAGREETCLLRTFNAQVNQGVSVTLSDCLPEATISIPAWKLASGS